MTTIAERLRRAERFIAEVRRRPEVGGLLGRLAAELPPGLEYHGAGHTEDVIKEVVVFASLDDLPDERVTRLGVAAAFHDAGFLVTREDHEAAGAGMAREILGRAGYAREDVEAIGTMILETRAGLVWTGTPGAADDDASYLVDADMSNLGRGDFFRQSERVRRESGEGHDVFWPRVLALLRSHRWRTGAASAVRDEVTRFNRDRLEKMLGADRDAGRAALVRESAAAGEASGAGRREALRGFLSRIVGETEAEAATVFLLRRGGTRAEFTAVWPPDPAVEGAHLPADRGILGHVLKTGVPAVVADARTDPRFYPLVDELTGRTTISVACVPVAGPDGRPAGAVELINRPDGPAFGRGDLLFLGECAAALSRWPFTGPSPGPSPDARGASGPERAPEEGPDPAPPAGQGP